MAETWSCKAVLCRQSSWRRPVRTFPGFFAVGPQKPRNGQIAPIEILDLTVSNESTGGQAPRSDHPGNPARRVLGRVAARAGQPPGAWEQALQVDQIGSGGMGGRVPLAGCFPRLIENLKRWRK